MKLFENKSECCGCGACANICPKNAIELKNDELGFPYPHIDKQLCIDCGMCRKVCAFINPVSQKRTPLCSYAAASRHDEVLKRSTSGGIFAEFAKHILKNQGVVYGCAYDSEFNAVHIEITDEKDLHHIQGSKYVQSNMTDTMHRVKDHLCNGEVVLYSGTPCQIDALRSYLGKDYEKLYCVDIICHGVGSPVLFKEDISVIAKGEKIEKVSFRDKSKGWGTHGSIITETYKYRFETINSPYYYYYLRNSIYRDSCYNCKYPSQTRVGDITLGDYWRVESAHSKINETIDIQKGISCVLVNTNKGLSLMNEVFNSLNSVLSDYEKISARNGQLSHCCTEPKIRKEIFDAYTTQGYDGVIRFWKKRSKKHRFVLRLKRLIPRSLKFVLKRLAR